MAYGARLESVLGASPRGFESPILRHLPVTLVVAGFFIFAALQAFSTRDGVLRAHGILVGW